MSADQYRCPGWPVIGADFAPIFSAGRTVVDLLQIAPEKLGLPAIGATAHKTAF